MRSPMGSRVKVGAVLVLQTVNMAAPVDHHVQLTRQFVAATVAEEEMRLRARWRMTRTGPVCRIAGSAQQIQTLLTRLHRMGLCGFTVAADDAAAAALKEHPAVREII